MREALSDALRLHGYQTEEVGEMAGAYRLLERQAFDGLLCDLRFSDNRGQDLVAHARKHSSNLIILFMISQQSAAKAMKAIHLGADDFIFKPFSVDEVLLKFHRSLEIRMMQAENLALREQLRDHQMSAEIIGPGKSMQEILRLVQLVARTNSSVLITGEAGTGKELIAKVIHRMSERPNLLMQSVDCSAAPEILLESRLFGHVKGAYPEAVEDHPGCFLLADQGTVFLRDIGSLPARLQAKLLRVIQDREISPLGSEKTLAVDVRIIASSRIDLRELVQKEQFREDLFYRLNVIPVHLPALRYRREDIPALAAHFFGRIAARQSSPAKSLSPAAARWMLRYDWPGNVRQLETALEIACTLSGHRAVIQPEDLLAVVTPASKIQPGIPDFEIPPEGIPLNETIQNVERKLIEKALLLTGGNRNRAARLLSLKRTTLVEKLRKWKE